MRMMVMAGALAVASVLGAKPVLAIEEGPWCLHMALGMDSVGSRCDMRSYEMCRAAMGGLGGTYCTQNPYYHAAAAQPRPRKTQQRPR